MSSVKDTRQRLGALPMLNVEGIIEASQTAAASGALVYFGRPELPDASKTG
jgi:hypothetical protein